MDHEDLDVSRIDRLADDVHPPGVREAPDERPRGAHKLLGPGGRGGSHLSRVAVRVGHRRTGGRGFAPPPHAPRAPCVAPAPCALRGPQSPGCAHKDPDLRNTRRTQGLDSALVCDAVLPDSGPCVRCRVA
ncbi:hypothetical protein HMPREF1550_01250 [Actinomyces sp. oral taxon 877 str. F0543]|nr:hypothetical protein HMPREF1550_01250 [Actinomyces sp. oral taxon 877 str. F0543]